VRSTVKNLIPATALREHQKTTPHRARIATLTGRESAAESGSESAANRTWITARIGGSSPSPESEADQQPKTARPRHTPARPEPNQRLKEKLIPAHRSPLKEQKTQQPKNRQYGKSAKKVRPGATPRGAIPCLDLPNLSNQKNIPDRETYPAADKKHWQRCAAGECIPSYDDAHKHPKFNEYDR
jgi:hypothetical protein